MIDGSELGISSKKSIQEAHQSPDSNSIPRKDILTAAKGGGIAFAGMLFGYIVRFVFSIMVARTIGAEQWGLFALGITVVTTLSAISLLGLNSGVVRYMPIAVRRSDEAELRGIMQVGIGLPAIIGLFFAVIVLFLAEPISIQFFNDPRLTPVLRLFSFCIPLATLLLITSSINQGFKKMQYDVFSNNILFYLVKFPLTFLLLVLGLGVMGVVGAHLVALAAALVLSLYLIHTLFPLNRSVRIASRNPNQLLRFSLPVYLAQVVERLGESLETLMLGFLGLTIGVGIYAAALRLSAVGSIFYLSVVAISAPIISEMHSRGDKIQLKRFYQTTAKWTMTFNIPIFLIFVIFAEPLLSIFGTDFRAGATGLIILSFGPLSSASTGLGGTMINMTGHSKLTFVNSSLFLLATLGLGLLFIPLMGVAGAALATSLAFVMRNLLQMSEVYYLHQILPYNRSFLKPMVAGSIAAVLTYMINQSPSSISSVFQLALGVTELCVFYLIILIVLKLSEEDRMVFDNLRLNFNKITGKYFPK